MAGALHVLGLPWTQVNHDYLTCAYTQKVLKFCKMMLPHREVYLYAGDESDTEATELVPCFTEKERERLWGGNDQNDTFSRIDWNPTHEGWQTLNYNASKEIAKRKKPGDILCLIAGHAQMPVVRDHPDLLACEWGVGYEGVSTEYRAFESYAWMHYIYGKGKMEDGKFFDAVIPNFFEPDDFYIGEKEDYLVFLGRLVARKAPHAAADIAKGAGKRLLVAGPGATHVEPGKIVAPEVTIEGDHVEYVGPVNKKERADLLARASGMIVPTIYVGPFEGVHVEANLSGTPVFTTDWGVFTETVKTGLNGMRFRTLQEGINAVQGMPSWSDPIRIRQYAIDRFSLNTVGRQFEDWFSRLELLWGDGWYSRY